MRYVTKAVLLLTILLSLSSCGTTVEPGQRGLRWYPLTQGLTTETLKSGFYWRAPWNQVYLYDVQWRSYTETVDALSSDDLLVILKTAIIMRPIPEEVYFLARRDRIRFLSTCGQARIVGCRPKRRLQLSHGHSAGEEC